MPRLRIPSGSRNRLHGVELDHRIGNRRAGGKGDAVAGVLLSQIAGFHVQVKGTFAASGLNAGDAIHFRRRFQVLEKMGLVDEEMIDAQFVKHQPVIFLVLGEQFFQFFFAFCFLLFDRLNEIAMGSRCILARSVDQQLVVFLDLFAEELLLIFPRHADSLEAELCVIDDAVPLAAGDFGGQKLAAFLACKSSLPATSNLALG